MRELVYLGPVPADEPCAQVGTGGYDERAAEECGRYVLLLRSVLGPEPPGARLRVHWSNHDHGAYAEVVCEFDPESSEQAAYALRCEAEAPTNWGQ